MYSENKVFLIGHVGSVEVKPTANGRMATVSLATNTSWRDRESGDRKERTEWHRCVSFRPAIVDLIGTHVAKGDYLRVEGELRYGSFDQDGVTHRTCEIVIERIGFLEPRSRDDAAADDVDSDAPY